MSCALTTILLGLGTNNISSIEHNRYYQLSGLCILFSVFMAEATVETTESPVETPTSLEDTEKVSSEGQ